MNGPDIIQDCSQSQPLRAGVYVIATPIGNLGDITLRALEVLKTCDIIYCEDTRVSGKLLNYYGIKKQLYSYHDHNEDQKIDMIVNEVRAGKIIALMSDAGMPLISDPGFKLVRACAEADIYVTSLPGANSPLMALQLSGLPSDKFVFLGFLPNKTKARREALAPYAHLPASIIFFESAQRITDSLDDVLYVCGDRDVAVCRELTKFYEEIKRGSVSKIIQEIKNHAIKGEVVVVVAPAQQSNEAIDIDDMLRDVLSTQTMRDAVDHVIAQTGLPRKTVYNRALELRAELDHDS